MFKKTFATFMLVSSAATVYGASATSTIYGSPYRILFNGMEPIAAQDGEKQEDQSPDLSSEEWKKFLSEKVNEGNAPINVYAYPKKPNEGWSSFLIRDGYFYRLAIPVYSNSDADQRLLIKFDSKDQSFAKASIVALEPTCGTSDNLRDASYEGKFALNWVALNFDYKSDTLKQTDLIAWVKIKRVQKLLQENNDPKKVLDVLKYALSVADDEDKEQTLSLGEASKALKGYAQCYIHTHPKNQYTSHGFHSGVSWGSDWSH